MASTERRKLLTAAVGVATVSYVVACTDVGGKGVETSGNLVAAGGYDFGGAGVGGNIGQEIRPRDGSGGAGPLLDAGEDGALPPEDAGTGPAVTADATPDATPASGLPDANVPGDAAAPDPVDAAATDAANP